MARESWRTRPTDMLASVVVVVVVAVVVVAVAAPSSPPPSPSTRARSVDGSGRVWNADEWRALPTPVRAAAEARHDPERRTANLYDYLDRLERDGKHKTLERFALYELPVYSDGDGDSKSNDDIDDNDNGNDNSGDSKNNSNDDDDARALLRRKTTTTTTKLGADASWQLNFIVTRPIDARTTSSTQRAHALVDWLVEADRGTSMETAWEKLALTPDGRPLSRWRGEERFYRIDKLLATQLHAHRRTLAPRFRHRAHRSWLREQLERELWRRGTSELTERAVALLDKLLPDVADDDDAAAQAVAAVPTIDEILKRVHDEL